MRSFPAHVETPRLLGDRITRADADALVAIVGDPGIPEEAFPARLRRPGQTRASVDRMVRHWEEHGFGLWTARERQTGEIVGRVGVMSTVVAGEEAVEAAWFIARSRWGRGYAPELGAVALRHAFGSLALTEVVSFTTAANRASQRVMLKLSFTLDGEVEHEGLRHVLYRRGADTPT